MTREEIRTDAAPQAIGTYSQGMRSNGIVYISGQIPLDPTTGELIAGDTRAHIARVVANLAAVAEAAGGSLGDIVKLTVFLTDLGDFALVNEVMAAHFTPPYPARSAVQVAGLPKGATVEMEAILVPDA